jgi:hypothetical protein
MMYLGLYFRSPAASEKQNEKFHKHTGRADGHVVHVPISFAWTEGADDLHVHFEDGGDGFLPFLSETTGDWIAPHPVLPGHMARVYCLTIRTTRPVKRQIADEEYVKFLKRAWPSGNCESPDLYKTRAFERLLRKTYSK